MDPAEPSIDTVELIEFNVVRTAFYDVSPGFRDRNFALTKLRRVRYLKKRMPNGRQISQYPIERAVAHKDLLLQALYRGEKPSSRERTVLREDGQGLALGAGQAAIDSGELFQVTPQRGGNERECRCIRLNKAFDGSRIRRRERAPGRLSHAKLGLSHTQPCVG